MSSAPTVTIKSVSMSGFRSFRQVDMASSGWELSEGHTAVVGRNGSGKSNIFEALEFVLCSPRLSTLRPADRQRLLNGTSAFVEVVLENRGGRLPKELGEEVVLRRCLGLKKDEFFLNRRRVAKKEVESLLDHGGLHSSTFVLRQGSVSALCAAKDEERLDLVKRLGGAAAFEDGRTQTTGILADAEAKANDAARDIDLIETRLDELEEEKDELQEYERLERQRRAITYALYDAELRETTQELQDIEEEGRADDDATEDKTEVLWDRKKRCRQDVDACRERLDRARAAYASAQDVVDERRGAMSRAATRRARLSTELEQLQRAVANDDAAKASMRRALRQELRKLASSDEPKSSSSSSRQEDAVVAEKRREAALAFARAKSARDEAAALSERVVETVAKRSAISARARESRLDAEKYEDEAQRCGRKVREARASLNHSAPYAVRVGLEALEKARVPTHGPIASRIRLVDDKYRTAVEVAAGPQLWHVVVDDDQAAADAAEVLERNGAGRLTLLPLSRLRVSDRQRAAEKVDEEDDVVPLLETALDISDEEREDVAMTLIFGDKLLARDLETASRYSASIGLDAVTLQGDKVSRRGAIEGGSSRDDDRHRSPLLAFAVLREAEAALESAKQASIDAATRADRLAREDALPVEKELVELEERRNAARRAAKLAQRDHDRFATDARELGRRSSDVHQSSLERCDELRSKLGLSNEDDIGQDDDGEIEEAFVAPEDEDFAASAEERVARLKEIRSEIEALRLNDDSELVGDSSSLAADVDSARAELDRALAQENAADESLAEATKAAENAAARISTLRARREERVRKLRQAAASVSPAELEIYKDLPPKRLMRHLDACNRDRRKYDHVNRKALDQYVNFADQRRDLTGRKTELDKAKVAVKDLVEALDNRKDQTILDTFQTVAAHFSTVFSLLEPAGKARLRLVRNDLPAARKQEETAREDSLETFSGVAIDVVFDGKPPVQMAQLSGGQKAIVSLALLFALHRADPSPFYLFDEVDAALDPDKRVRLAKLVSQLAQNGTQIITTTFSSELVQAAQAHFGVSVRNGNSTIEPITKDDALAFVADVE